MGISFSPLENRSTELRLPIPSSRILQSANSEVLRHTSRMNIGPNISRTSGPSNPESNESLAQKPVVRSSLFWYLLLLIALPTLLSIIAISILVAARLNSSFPEWIRTAKDTSFDIEYEGLEMYTQLKARYAEEVLPGPLRDLYVVTRMAGWLLFDAIGRSDSFTEVESELVEECKVYGPEEVCPYESDDIRSPCDCSWNDPWNRECKAFPADPRSLQRMFYLAQKRDFDPETGWRHKSSSYPDVDFSPNTTSWWTDPDEMPGSNKGANASGHETTYDRLRVISAISTATLPVYNYVANSNRNHTAMSAGVAFEADGAYVAYSGCNEDFARYAHFQSSDDNGAYLINEDLCPKGKFGYDPRCRNWYDQTKEVAITNGDPVYVSPPYTYATVTDIGSTAASALIDPRSGVYVGCALITFSTTEMYNIVDNSTSDMYAIASPEAAYDSNIIASSTGIGQGTGGVVDVFFPYDPRNSTNRKAFTKVVENMSKGASGKGSTFRMAEDGTEEKIWYVYHPINIRELEPVMPDDFTRGVEASEDLLYSMIVGRKDNTFYSEFNDVEGEIKEDLSKISIIYLISTSIVTLICVIVTARVS